MVLRAIAWIFWSFVAAKPAPKPFRLVQVDVQNGKLVYQQEENSTPLVYQTSLKELKFFGELASVDGQLYSVISGKWGGFSEEERFIFLVWPQSSKLEKSQPFYLYPGRILEPGTRHPVLESRAFFGNCLSNKDKPHLVFFQREKVDRKTKSQESVLIVTPIPGQPMQFQEELLELHLPKLKPVVNAVLAKKCTEILGIERTHSKNLIKLSPSQFPNNTELEKGTEKAQESDLDENEKSPSLIQTPKR